MIGTSIAHYTVTEKIGAGGMGEVYRASDGKLRRDVALKVLPELFASDSQRMARFEREAHVLASLNHPNIASIYGLEKENGRHCLVLELVEGEDLSQRLRSGPMPVEEALETARQIAEALEAAHEKGVIHRDLKPANVKISADGAVKVLDFGLAKALDDDPGASSASAAGKDLSHSPTLTVAATRAGIVLGTAAYMSPEQAKGKSVDRRADIWSFGAVLYEMLTREQCFTGETVSDTLASVLKEAPDWSRLQEETPAAVVDLLQRCLEKDPRQRLQSIGEARIAIQRALRGPDASTMTGLTGTATAVASLESGAASRRGPGAAIWGASLIVVALLAGFAGTFFGPSAPEPRTRKFHIDPDGLKVEYPTQPALSPDGRKVAYFVGSDLWIRDLNRLEASKIPDSEGSSAPFWSPDGAWLAFGLGNRIYRVPASGGTPTAVCDVPFSVLDGGMWGEDDMLYLAPNSGPILTVSSRGGDPRPLFPPEPGESDYHTPTPLPGGRGIFYTTHRSEGRDTIEVYADDQRKVLLRIPGARLEYAAWAPSGHLVFHRMNTNTGIWAVPFDLDSLEITGEPFILDPDGSFPSVARDGSLVYALGAGGGMVQLVKVNRKGESIGTIGQPQAGMQWPELSPDGSSVLVSAQEADNRDIWLHDVERGTRTRMTFSVETDWSATWINGGEEILFTYGSGQSTKTWRRPADGSGEPELFVEGYHVSTRDGVDIMAFNYFDSDGGDGIHYRPVDGGGEAKPFLATAANELGPQISPDGKHIIYMSNESGSNEIYLTTFPSGQGKWQVSTDGGAWPRWSRAGDEIFYREGVGASARIMSVSVQTEPSLRLSSPVRLFGSGPRGELVMGMGFRGIDVTSDPDLFVMLKMTGDEQEHRTRLVYSENWFEAYRKTGE